MINDVFKAFEKYGPWGDKPADKFVRGIILIGFAFIIFLAALFFVGLFKFVIFGK